MNGNNDSCSSSSDDSNKNYNNEVRSDHCQCCGGYVRCSIYWDYENIQIPHNCTPFHVVQALEKYLNNLNWIPERKCVYGNDSVPSAHIRHKFAQLGYNVVEVSSKKAIRVKTKRANIARQIRDDMEVLKSSSSHDAHLLERIVNNLESRIEQGIEQQSNEQVDMRIMVDMMSNHGGCTYDCHHCDVRLNQKFKTCGIVLLSGDADFAHCLKELKSKVRVLVISIHRSPLEFSLHVHHKGYWRDIVNPEDNDDENGVVGAVHNTSMTPDRNNKARVGQDIPALTMPTHERRVSDASTLPTFREQADFHVQDLISVVAECGGGHMKLSLLGIEMKKRYPNVYEKRRFKRVWALAVEKHLARTEGVKGGATLVLTEDGWLQLRTDGGDDDDNDDDDNDFPHFAATSPPPFSSPTSTLDWDVDKLIRVLCEQNGAARGSDISALYRDERGFTPFSDVWREAQRRGLLARQGLNKKFTLVVNHHSERVKKHLPSSWTPPKPSFQVKDVVKVVDEKGGCSSAQDVKDTLKKQLVDTYNDVAFLDVKQQAVDSGKIECVWRDGHEVLERRGGRRRRQPNDRGVRIERTDN